MQQALQQHFGPQLQVHLVNHPPAPTQALLAKLLVAVQLAALGVVIAGQQAAPYLARVGVVLPPETWQTIAEKKIGLLMGIWFIGALVLLSLLLLLVPLRARRLLARAASLPAPPPCPRHAFTQLTFMYSSLLGSPNMPFTFA